MSNSKGYTIVELVVVIFILGSIVAIAVPNIIERTDIKLKSASRNLSGTIRYLYNEAILRKEIYKLVFDIEEGEYWSEVLEGNEFVKKEDFIFKKKSLPSGVDFENIETERTKGEVGSGEEPFLLFLPSGYMDAAIIHLKTRKDNYFTLSTNPYTGITKVYDNYIEFYGRSFGSQVR